MRISRYDETVRADTCNDAVLAFVVVDTLVSHAASDGLELVFHDAALTYDFPQIGFNLGFGNAESLGNLHIVASGFDVSHAGAGISLFQPYDLPRLVARDEKHVLAGEFYSVALELCYQRFVDHRLRRKLFELRLVFGHLGGVGLLHDVSLGIAARAVGWPAVTASHGVPPSLLHCAP